jgi:formylglycine-generating enzyme required for sulfatase activity
MLVAILSLPNTRAQAQASSRPTEKVVPAPPVNPEAVVWRTAVPPVQATAGDVWVDQQGCAMAYVPAGEFVMGGPSGEGDADEQPPRQVFLEGYWIDRLLVTVAQYRQFCQATGREMPLAPDWGWYEHHPVVNVSWGEATAYAKWAGKRLPTEAEWEKAARGPEGRRFPWGDEWDPKKCSNSSNSRSTQPVGSYPSGASPYGLLDMSGNVWQWCMDWYDESYYRIAPSRNPTGPAAGRHRVLRGGSWECDKPGYFRAARRDYKHFVPDGRDNYDGFRCVIGPVTAD